MKDCPIGIMPRCSFCKVISNIPHIFMMALVLTSACMFCPLEQQQHQTNPLSTTNVD